jgi:hypothetical protein
VLGDFALLNAGGVAGMATGGWAFGAMRAAGAGLLTSGAAAGVVGDLTVQASDNAAWLATGGQYGRSGINGTELALSAGLGALPGLPGAIRGWADDLRGLGVPDWNIRFASPYQVNSIGAGLELERIGGSQLLSNQLPNQLAAELRVASKMGVDPLSIVDPRLADVVNAGRVKWAINEGGDLLVIPHSVGNVEIAHSVLTRGNPVLAAGEADIAAGAGKFIGVDFSTHSGHYLNGCPSQGSSHRLSAGQL